MNWLDIIIIVVLVGSAFGGMKNGLIKSVLSLIGLIVAIKLAGLHYVNVAGSLNFITNETAARIAAFGIILAAVMLITLVISYLLTKIVASLTLGWLNGLGGALFGLFMGTLVISTLLALWARFFGMPQIISDSSLAVTMIKVSAITAALLPAEFDLIRNLLN